MAGVFVVIRRDCHRILSDFVADKRGNFAVLAAFLIPVGLAAAELAMDVSSLMAVRTKVQAAADSAAIAAGAALANEQATVDQAKQLALSFVKGQLSQELGDIAQSQQQSGTSSPYGSFDIGGCTNVNVVQSTGVGTTKVFDVTVSTCLEKKLNVLGAFYGSSMQTLKATGSTKSMTASQKALSMYLVLDRSGSMADNTDTVTGTTTYSYSCGWRKTCTGTQNTYLTKIDALKQAADALMKQIATADPDQYYARLGAVSYNSAMDTPQALGWGTVAVSNYVNALVASGGTDSSGAFKQAYQSLTASTENSLHMSKNGQVPDKFIVFMTDGENNYASADTATKQWCDSARAAGVQVYSIAFMAPATGQALLSYCATDANHFFAANNASDMIAAFKYIGQKAVSATTRLTQ
ncbi:MAG TPA: vWA domain-containing protein [Ensifer sp.]|nr:vWA domain-containing protein [Ensifer sp.]